MGKDLSGISNLDTYESIHLLARSRTETREMFLNAQVFSFSTAEIAIL